MPKSLLVIYITVCVSAMGFGITMPVLPALLRSVGHLPDITWQFGAFLSLYAAMQFIFSPLLGSLSDYFGRRPVLLVSLAGATLDNLLMAFAPTLWLLFLGRAIAGMTGANAGVAGAYIADVVPENERARHFALLAAAFGVGFILGPVIGGLIGDNHLRYTFIAAAILNAANFLIACFALPESRTGARHGFRWGSLNPLAAIHRVPEFRAIGPLLAVAVVFGIIGETGATIWVIYGTDKFAWTALTTGLSLAGFGLFHAGVQAFLVAPLTHRLGERRAMFLSITCDVLAYVLIALATQGWMAFVLLPLFCLGGIHTPLLMSLLSKSVDEHKQGELQGLLASLAAVASIIGPLVVSLIYSSSRQVFPGLVWIIAALLYVPCIPVLLKTLPRDLPDQPSPDISGARG